MTASDLLHRDFAYDAWANRESIAAIQASGAYERSLQLMAHILSAKRIWLERLKDQPQSSPVWPEADMVACEQQAREMGELWTSTVLDVLTHVVMHSAYHRGQIASHLRANGKTPASTGYIHGVRQGFVK